MSEETKPASADAEKARIAGLREARRKREEKATAEAEAREVLELELEDRFEKELGPRGKEFEIVNSSEGPIVVKRGESAAVLYKKFQASMAGSKDPTPEDIYAYVAPCVVYPSVAVFGEILDRRPHIGMRCANSLLVLQGFKEASDRGKY